MTPAGAVAAALRDVPGPIGVAVSGGGDSMALLLAALGAGAQLRVATVNHGLRPESAAEAEGVARFCAERGVAHETLVWRWDGAGNLPARAREGRLDALAGWAGTHGLSAVLLGHTRDDVAETFLMRLSRRAGVDGLSAMTRAFRHDGTLFLRPLLDQPRECLRDFLRDSSVSWVEDPSNDDPRYERTRARQTLKALAPLGIDAGILSDVADQMRGARAALDAGVLDLVERGVRQDGGDLLISPAVLDAPDELIRRLHVAAIRWIGRLPYPPRRAELERLVAAARAGRSATLAGVQVVPGLGELRLTREFAAVRDLSTPTTTLWDGRWRLSGPHAPGLTLKALGAEGLSACPAWRDTGRPRTALLATPAVWSESGLVAAPLVGYPNGWRADAATFRDELAARSPGN